MIYFVVLVIVLVRIDPYAANEKCTDGASDCAIPDIGTYINPNIVITEFQKKSYKKNGFLIVPNALSTEQLEIWRNLIDTSVASRGTDHIFPVKDQLDTVNIEFDFYKNVFVQRLNLWQNDEAVRELIGSAGYTIGRIATELEGIDGVRMHHDQALYKAPYANPTSFHIDVPHWTFDSIHGITMWMALDNITMHNGCMYFIAGSSQTMAKKDDPYKLINIGKNMNELFENYYPEFLDDKYKSIAAPINAGDMIFHNGLGVHGAQPNFTNKRRRAMTIAMFPDGSVFNGKKNILTDKQFNNMKIGELLNDKNQNPVLYSKHHITDNHPSFFSWEKYPN